MNVVSFITGQSRQLDSRAGQTMSATEKDVQDPSKLARMLTDLLRVVAQLKTRFYPRRIDFEDRDVIGDNATEYRFVHGFNGRVRWWPVGARNGYALLKESPSTDSTTLVLISAQVCTVTIRVEEAG